ncbi:MULTISPECIES: two-component system sensor histidine kinase NtrB [Stenotrophomonas]|uniref:histidine kinase n=1 Tax=Stenotrophomonas lactitubi TaxID=2045214 RepID=A0AAW4GIY8_9GAMM|nr:MULTISPECIES: PAS domain-containing sensor histidine kinase [Stenotrophomonas]MBM9913895.1 PAS domain S-box protein [Stenotrophomonas lactitubi]MBM9921888.1 PAS domain S-box protein [Stenotrophomonas lactitubi]MBM9938940.1 PAS domain S-box protein [Stenotrophomonas lactitubi]
MTRPAKPESVLRDESRQFAMLVNSVTDYAVYMLDPTGVIQTWNPGGQRIKGYVAADVVGTNFSRFYLPEEAEIGLPERNLRTAAAEGRYIGEGWRLRQDGTRFRASVVIDPIWEDGELMGFAKITRDITERHEAQEQLLQAQRDLLQAQKMEAIGKFTLGLAHDFNNLLTIVVNCLDLISMRVKDGAVAKLIDTAQRAAERGALLTRQLLTFGKGQTLVPEAVDLAAMMAECEALLRRSAGAAIALTVEIPRGLPTLSLDKAQLEAAVLNLVCNSRDAMPKGGTITITASARLTRDPTLPNAAKSPYVCLSVQDDGTGIEVDQQVRVFEPFFTTKPIGRGSGLGLSQVFGFTAQSGGFTELKSEPGKGTCVSLCFPAPEH